ncbi:hypothetical protein AQZ52_13950 [Novosphingobium fuchskuhlense]|uniref:Right handed beta helix domain-containing protein n=1 Tax=Novosphingobium fuchskuhlense TaxID=1117702 RepID=A0A117UU92_9SPHN|nr:parallel beta-helix domain-containing protein [Novosphingobium fuchskuhlense]KUR70913.1 hypothetical protein AQZ52_13950 [Novosphingobium fuchskuhlense]
MKAATPTHRALLAGAAACVMALCSPALAAPGAPDADGFVTDRAFEKHLAEQLLDARPGDVITIPEGKWKLMRGLSLTAPGVTIRGAGRDRTVLSFAGMVSGPVGLQVTGDRFTLADLTVQDTKGDGVKVNGTKGVTIRAVRVRWTNPDKATHGAYGLYPVGCTDVLIEDSEVFGSSDAGIYVGQSDNIIVRRNRAEQNVAGIEIENSTHADVYDNVATGNTGGILVFNMPNLPKPGGFTRLHNNVSEANNTPNFGAKGTAVSIVPAGTGMIVLANDDVEIFDNVIRGNNTVGIAIASDYSTNYKIEAGSPGAHDPYPERVLIANNVITGTGGAPDNALFPAAQAILAAGQSVNLVWDGFARSDGGDNGICVAAGGDKLVRLDAAHPGQLTLIPGRDCSAFPRQKAVVIP